MKRRTLCVLLGAEAALCVMLQFGRAFLPQWFGAAMAFPFEQLGLLLRAMSLSGGIGNACALILYAALCLCPVLALLLAHRKRKLYPEDALLGVCCVLLFFVLYAMINPAMLANYPGMPVGQSVYKALLGGIVYSVIVGYFVLRLLRSFASADTGRLQRYLSAMLLVLNVVFIYLAFGGCLGELLDSIAALRAGNTGDGQSLGVSCAFLILQYGVNALPYVLDVLIVFALLDLLREQRAERYSDGAARAADRLSRLCGTVLAVTVLTQTGFNLLQLIFLKTLRVVNGVLAVPLLSMAVALIALVFAQYIRESKRLKDDNDMII